MDRFTKQLVYGTAYLAILALLATGAYFAFFRSSAGCDNGRRDANEEDVDCGGACSLVCLPSDLRPIVVESASVFTPLSNRVSALIKIKNPNANLAARNLPYTLNLMDAGRRVVRTISGTTFIYGGEIKYLAAYIDTAGLAKIAAVEAKLGNPEWAKLDNFRRPEIILQSRTTSADAVETRVAGRIANRDTVAFREAKVMAIFYGSTAGKSIGVSETTLDNLGAGEARDFAVIHPPIAGIDSTKTEVVIAARRP
ncbi:MAG: hypothetical protein AAB867_01865 [Patescibacteria group bacterium]